MTNISIACIVVGIDGWQTYSLPLIQSIHEHEPECCVVVIDNASKEPYPKYSGKNVLRIARACYSKAINHGHTFLTEWDILPDWYIVLSNDVLCTGPFAHVLAGYSETDVVGPLLKEVHGFPYLEGWAIATHRKTWEAIGGWDEAFDGSSWEDVWWSTEARLRGCELVEDLPFVHLDQRQRYHVISDFGAMDTHNREYFLGKYGQWAGK